MAHFRHYCDLIVNQTITLITCMYHDETDLIILPSFLSYKNTNTVYLKDGQLLVVDMVTN